MLLLLIGSLLLAYLLCRIRLSISIRAFWDKLSIVVRAKLSVAGVTVYKMQKKFTLDDVQPYKLKRQPTDWQRLLYAVSQARFERIFVRLAGGADEMAALCQIYGLLAGMLHYFCAAQLHISPIFALDITHNERLTLFLECIFSLQLGQIIYMAGKHFYERRLKHGKRNEWFNADRTGAYSQHD